MTDKQPKALWLADELEKYTYDFEWHSTAADELRRLHEVNVELVEALEHIIKGVPDTWWGVKNARAALVKATGENNG